ncbi:hypothetical protein [Azohydromonas lata]|uniref:hypothetical protein n=1 Tax=Azohydromonas lata TaxID=45677 RepID=UPI000835FDBF|nr:hypothetical protein [Azohydromonas lata]
MGLSVEMDAAGGEARPCAVHFGTQRVIVNEVCDRWHSRDRTWWKVATNEGSYILVCEDATGDWDLAAAVGKARRDEVCPVPRHGASH